MVCKCDVCKSDIEKVCDFCKKSDAVEKILIDDDEIAFVCAECYEDFMEDRRFY